MGQSEEVTARPELPTWWLLHVDMDSFLAAGVAKTAINKATTDLNCVIERAVATANAADVNIHYVDVTEEFAGHGIVDPRSCTGSSAFIHSLLICDPDPGADPDDLEAFHPTAAGYSAYAEAIKPSCQADGSTNR